METLEDLVLEIAHRTCTTYSHLAREKCSFADHHTRDFATKLIAAWKEQQEQEPVAVYNGRDFEYEYDVIQLDVSLAEGTSLYLAPPPAQGEEK